MKVLIADAFPAERLADLVALGLEVDHRPDVKAGDLPDALGDASVLVVRSKQVTAEVFERGTALSLVVRAGAGTNTIDVAAASSDRDHACTFIPSPRARAAVSRPSAPSPSTPKVLP